MQFITIDGLGSPITIKSTIYYSQTPQEQQPDLYNSFKKILLHYDCARSVLAKTGCCGMPSITYYNYCVCVCVCARSGRDSVKDSAPNIFIIDD